MTTTRRQVLSWAATAFIPSSQREVQSVVAGRPTVDGAGVQLTRLIGHGGLRHLDPFVMMDRFHSNDPRAYMAGFPEHPHRGFETVTVMLDGHMLHQDSRGNRGDIVGGGAQWMTAGKGILHSEMPRQEQGWLSGFQLWVNLPAREKLCAPYYQDLQPKALAQGSLSKAGSTLRLIAGRHQGLVGPVRERPTAPLLGTVMLEDDAPFELEVPEHHHAFAFVGAGEVDIGPASNPTVATEGALAVLSAGKKVRLRAKAQRSLVLVAAGKPLREAMVQRGPFVMSNEAEIEKAWADYRAGTLGRD